MVNTALTGRHVRHRRRPAVRLLTRPGTSTGANGTGTRDLVLVTKNPGGHHEHHRHEPLRPRSGPTRARRTSSSRSRSCPSPTSTVRRRSTRPRLARGRRLPDQRGLPGPAVHAARLAGVDHLRHRRHRRHPGRGGSLLLVVEDIEAARAELIERGVDVAEVFHGRGFSDAGQDRIPGPAPDGQSYASFAAFSDPDGNELLLQEVTYRLPGRVESPTSPRLPTCCSRRLSRTAASRPHAAAQLVGLVRGVHGRARAGQHGRSGDEAADGYMKEVHGLVPR